MLVKGFRFGMILQLSIGPMCLLVFNTATVDLLLGLVLVLAITLVDASYITLAGIGVAAILDKRRIKIGIKVVGCLVLVLFGMNTMLSVFGITLLPQIQLFSEVKGTNIFWQGILLTASNPLTIIFWGGVFSTEAVDQKLTRGNLFIFGLGCILSTVIFLTSIAFLGSLVETFLPTLVIQGLNVLVGFILIIFGVRLVFKKDEKKDIAESI